MSEKRRKKLTEWCFHCMGTGETGRYQGDPFTSICQECEGRGWMFDRDVLRELSKALAMEQSDD